MRVFLQCPVHIFISMSDKATRRDSELELGHSIVGADTYGEDRGSIRD